MADDWLVWQLADSAFPAGSFAHSGGLEAAWQQGRVMRGDSLMSFVEAALGQAAYGAVPLVLSSHREPGRFAEWDRLCDAILTNHVANRASRTQGQSLLAASQRIFGLAELSELQSTVRRAGSPTHLAPVFGAVAGALGLHAAQTGRLFLFLTLRGLISSAVRLGIIGPMEGQTVQMEMSGPAERLAKLAMHIPPDDAAQTAPILDLLQGAQDRLYSRLFQS